MDHYSNQQNPVKPHNKNNNNPKTKNELIKSYQNEMK